MILACLCVVLEKQRLVGRNPGPPFSIWTEVTSQALCQRDSGLDFFLSPLLKAQTRPPPNPKGD